MHRARWLHVPNVAAGYVEIGEIRRRLGDLQGAEEAFAKADELCGLHSPGLALVRLAQRRIDAARTIIARLLAEQPWSRLARARLLPARVQIAVAAGELDDATEAVVELDSIAADSGSPAMTAAALSARRLLLAEGKERDACATLQQALQRWQQLEVPYEVATGGAAARPGTPQRRRRGCCPSFVRSGGGDIRLGAALDSRHTHDLTSPSTLPAGLSEREAEVLTMVASGQTNKDIAGTLNLSERTVARHLSNIFTKLGVNSRTAAAAFAYENDLAPPTTHAR